jgi:segregation and condensation protein B
MQETDTSPAEGIEAVNEPITPEAAANGTETSESVTPEGLLPDPQPEAYFPGPDDTATETTPAETVRLTAIIEAIVYLTDQPLSVEQIAGALKQAPATVAAVLKELTAEFERPEHGVAIRVVAGGFSMATKAEHHDEVRAFVKNMTPAMKLSLPSLETLSVIAYRQPITAPEIMEIRGVQGAGVLKTLLDRKLIAAAGRKNVIGKPILYKTTKEFLIQFGLKDLNELPSLKEFDEIRRLSIPEETPSVEMLPLMDESPAAESPAAPEAVVAAPEAPAEAAVEAPPEGSQDNGA